jgi:hypothetical protein
MVQTIKFSMSLAAPYNLGKIINDTPNTITKFKLKSKSTALSIIFSKLENLHF